MYRWLGKYRFWRELRKYWYIFVIQVTNSLAYPGELVGRSLMIIPFMWIFAQLWKVTFAASGTAEINGLTLPATLWYLVMTETIELSRPRIGNAIAAAVKDGSIAYVLNKPYDFLLYQFSTSMGETIFRAVLTAFFGSLVMGWMIGPPPHLWGFVVAFPALLGAWVLNYYVAVLVGLAAFVSEDVNAYQWILQKLAFIFGGLLIPLDFYPGWLRAIANALPFPAMLYAPSRLFVEPTLAGFASTLGIQVAWIVVLGLLTRLAYRRGVAALVVNGG